jgi:putative transposase
MALLRVEEFEAAGASAVRRSGRCGAGRGSIVPFFAFAPSIRKMIYTTNAVEALHRPPRKIIKVRGSFPNDDRPQAGLPRD